MRMCRINDLLDGQIRGANDQDSGRVWYKRISAD